PAFFYTPLIKTRHRVRHQDDAEVALGGLVDRRPWAVRIVTSGENQCIAPAFVEVLLKFGAVEGPPPRLVYHVLGRTALLQAAGQEQFVVQRRGIGNVGQQLGGNL